MLRYSKFSQREKQARKWTFVRDWENEPTPVETDFRTTVSPRAEIITSPPPEVVSLPGGRQIVRGSPVPVLLNTSLSPRQRSARKTQGRQVQEDRSIPQESRRSAHRGSADDRSKTDNSVDESAALPEEDDSTQNNPGTDSDTVSEQEAPSSQNNAGSDSDMVSEDEAIAAESRLNSVSEERESEEEMGGERLVGLGEYRELSRREEDSEAPRETGSRTGNPSHGHSVASVSRKRSDNSRYSKEIQDMSILRSSPEKRGALQTSKGNKPTPHSPVKRVKQTLQPAEASDQSVIQLAIETPVVQVKKKLVKPRVILAGSADADKKKKKRVRDKSSELTIQMWMGRDGDRRKKDVVDLDVILHGITETLTKCREEFTEKPQQRALSKFVSHIRADIATEIENRENVKEINSNVKKSKKNVQSLRKELQGLQNRKDSLLQKIEKAETESSACDISRWMFGFQKFIKKNRTLMTKLSTIDEEDFVKVV